MIPENMVNHGYDISKSKKFSNLLKGFSLAERDNDREKEQFDKYLLGNTYDKLSFCIWEISYEISFAVSMMYGLEHGINGSKLNDYIREDTIRNIYLNIFPSKSKSYCIWSWLKANDDIY